jgi:hypothetical protein
MLHNTVDEILFIISRYTQQKNPYDFFYRYSCSFGGQNVVIWISVVGYIYIYIAYSMCTPWVFENTYIFIYGYICVVYIWDAAIYSPRKR